MLVTVVLVTCCWLWLGVSLRPVAEVEVRLGAEPDNQYNHTDPGEGHHAGYWRWKQTFAKIYNLIFY